MANLLAPFGFAEAARTGGAPNYQMSRRLILSSYGTQIFSGDPVVQVSSGYIQQAAPGTTQIAGIFMGCEYYSIAMKRPWWSPYFPANSDVSSSVPVYANVIDDPQMVFRVQANALATQAYVGQNANFAIGTGNTTTGLSGATLDISTVNTTSTLPFRITSLITDPPGSNGADTTTAYNWAYVTFNWQDFKSTTGI